MSLVPTWDKISSANNSTTAEFGGNWGNLISDYFNGVNIALTEPTKVPTPGTLTRFKHEKLGLFDVDQSHYIVFSADDIDTGPVRKVKFRRMNAGFEEDYAVLETLPQPFINKIINADLNSISNIEDADIKAAANIATSKLAEGLLFAKINFANVFTAAQAIQVNTTFPLTLARLNVAAGSSNALAFEHLNEASTRKLWAHINVINQTVTAGAEEGVFRISMMHAGTIAQILEVTGNVTTIGFSPARASLDTTGITTTRTYTFQNASGKFPLLEFANVFTTAQKIQYAFSGAFTVYRPDNTVGNGIGCLFDLQNNATTPAEVTFAQILAVNVANTAGAESGALGFWTRAAGTIAERMYLDHLNRLRIGLSGAGMVLDPTGISGSSKIITMPNADVKVLGETNSQSVTNKYVDDRLNTTFRQHRYGSWTPDGARGALDGAVVLGADGGITSNTGGKYRILNTANVTNACAGIVKLGEFAVWRTGNPLFRSGILFSVTGSTTRRVFKGFGAQRLINLDSDTAPLNSNEFGILFGYGAGDTQWQIFHNDATGTCVKESTGITLPAVDTNLVIEIAGNNSGAGSWTWALYGIIGTTQERGALLGTGTITTRIPISTTSLYVQDLMITSDGTVRPHNLHFVEVYN